MLIAGIGLSSYGIIGLISLFIQMQKINNNPYVKFGKDIFYKTFDEDMFHKMLVIDFTALAIGIVLIIFAIMKSKNKNKLDELQNFEKNTFVQTKCKSCGLNLSENTDICPKCVTHINKI